MPHAPSTNPASAQAPIAAAPTLRAVQDEVVQVAALSIQDARILRWSARRLQRQHVIGYQALLWVGVRDCMQSV